MSATDPATQAPPDIGPPHGKLGVWDTVCIIVGIVIGSSIFTTPPIIFEKLLTPWEGLGIWLVGGALSLIGALCYAELTTTYPKAGGDYVYLTRAFGRPTGFLFGWAQLVVILSGSTGAMAFIFGEYAAGLLGVTDAHRPLFTAGAACTAVVVLSVMNFFGVVFGKWLQDVLVLVKLGGLALIVLAGLYYSTPGALDIPAGTELTRGGGGIGVAMILVLYAYGGWNDAAFVASDLRNPRNMTKALVLGTLLITAVYFLVNLAYIFSYGWLAVRNFNPTLAVGVLEPLSPAASRIIAVLVMTSALGAMNGLIFTGSRVYYSLGSEHRVFSLLGKWNRTFGAPIWSITIQALITLVMILQVGTETGREWTNRTLGAIGIPAIPWGDYFGGFNTLFAGTAPVFWIFFLLTGLAFFVLRVKDAQLPRPFHLRLPWFPLLPLIFCAMCVFGIYSALTYAKWVSLIGFIPLAIGVPLYLLSREMGPSAPAQNTQGDNYV